MIRSLCTVIMLLLLMPVVARGAEQKVSYGRERTLGDFTLGEAEGDVRKKLGERSEHAGSGILTSGGWSAWIDPKTGRLKGIAYEEQKTIGKSKHYPRTVKGITIGDTFKEAVGIYGNPDLFLTARSPFILKNSDLVFISIYPSRGLWLTLRNQKPYSGEYDWRVAMIAVGEADVIEAMKTGASSYTVTPITPKKKSRTEAVYRSKFGKAGDLKIYDAYQFSLQAAYFRHVRSLGEYHITPLAIVPADDKKAQDLMSELTPTGGLAVRLAAEAEQDIVTKHRISKDRLAEIVANVQRFLAYQFAQGVEEHNKRLTDASKQGKGTAP